MVPRLVFVRNLNSSWIGKLSEEDLTEQSKADQPDLLACTCLQTHVCCDRHFLAGKVVEEAVDIAAAKSTAAEELDTAELVVEEQIVELSLRMDPDFVDLVIDLDRCWLF